MQNIKKLIIGLSAILVGAILVPSLVFAQLPPSTVPQGGTGTTTFPSNWFLIGNTSLRLTATGTPHFTNFTFVSATGTRATTSSLFSTTASTTNLFGNFINGFGLSTCTGSNFLQWSGGLFGCAASAGSGASTTLLSDNNTWSGTNIFNNISRSTTTQATTSNLAITSLTSALVQVDANGTTQEYGGTSCTNQFVRSLSALGIATCATVANTDLANSTISGISLGSNLADLTAGTGLTSAGTYNGGTARTFNLDLTAQNIWTGASTTFVNGITFGNSTTTNATSTTLAVSGSGTSTRITNNLNVGGNINIAGSATNTATNGFSISGGCFAVNNVCISGGGGSLSGGTAGMIASWVNSTSLTATGTPTFANFFGTSSATSTLTGPLLVDRIQVSSTTATSTFANGLNISAGCFAINGTCLSGSSGGTSSWLVVKRGVATSTGAYATGFVATTVPMTANQVIRVTGDISVNCQQQQIIYLSLKPSTGASTTIARTYDNNNCQISGYRMRSMTGEYVATTSMNVELYFGRSDFSYASTTNDVYSGGTTSIAYQIFEYGQAAGGGGGTPGGSDTQVQFNDGGSFGGDAGFTFNKTTDEATLTNIILTKSTTTSATTTSIFSGTASSTNLFSSRAEIDRATTSQATTSNFAITSLSSALLQVDANGSVAEYAGTSCTNQFVRSLSALGVATCATVANTDLANSTISGVALGGNLFALTNGNTLNGSSYNGSSAISDWDINLANDNIWTNSSTTFVNGVTIGNATTTNATSTTLRTGTLGVGSEYITDITGTGLAISGGALNTSNIPNASLQNSTISGISLGSNLADLTATNGTLTFSGTYNGSVARTIGLNLASENIWTGASTTFVGGVTIGTATTTGATSTTFAVTGSGTSTRITNNVNIGGNINVAGSATSTFTNGINLSGGCFAINNTCLSTGGSGTPGGSDGQVQYNNGGSFGGGTGFIWDDANNRLGIGSTSPNRILTVSGDQTGGIFQVERTPTTVGSLFGVADWLVNTSGTISTGDTGPTQTFRIKDSNGPTNTLGDFGFVTNTTMGTTSGKLIVRPYFQGAFYSETGYQQALAYDGSTGILALGSTSPSQTLCSADSLCIINSDFARVTMVASSTSASTIVRGIFDVRGDTTATSRFQFGTVSNHPLVFFTNDSERMRISADGHVGIGTSTPNFYQLTVSSSTRPQIGITDGSLTSNQHFFRSFTNSFWFGTSTSATGATSTVPIYSVDTNGFLQFGNPRSISTTTAIDLKGCSPTTQSARFAPGGTYWGPLDMTNDFVSQWAWHMVNATSSSITCKVIVPQNLAPVPNPRLISVFSATTTTVANYALDIDTYQYDPSNGSLDPLPTSITNILAGSTTASQRLVNRNTAFQTVSTSTAINSTLTAGNTLLIRFTYWGADGDDTSNTDLLFFDDESKLLVDLMAQ